MLGWIQVQGEDGGKKHLVAMIQTSQMNNKNLLIFIFPQLYIFLHEQWLWAVTVAVDDITYPTAYI